MKNNKKAEEALNKAFTPAPVEQPKQVNLDTNRKPITALDKEHIKIAENLYVEASDPEKVWEVILVEGKPYIVAKETSLLYKSEDYSIQDAKQGADIFKGEQYVGEVPFGEIADSQAVLAALSDKINRVSYLPADMVLNCMRKEASLLSKKFIDMEKVKIAAGKKKNLNKGKGKVKKLKGLPFDKNLPAYVEIQHPKGEPERYSFNTPDEMYAFVKQFRADNKEQISEGNVSIRPFTTTEEKSYKLRITKKIPKFPKNMPAEEQKAYIENIENNAIEISEDSKPALKERVESLKQQYPTKEYNYKIVPYNFRGSSPEPLFKKKEPPSKAPIMRTIPSGVITSANKETIERLIDKMIAGQIDTHSTEFIDGVTIPAVIEGLKSTYDPDNTGRAMQVLAHISATLHSLKDFDVDALIEDLNTQYHPATFEFLKEVFTQVNQIGIAVDIYVAKLDSPELIEQINKRNAAEHIEELKKWPSNLLKSIANPIIKLIQWANNPKNTAAYHNDIAKVLQNREKYQKFAEGKLTLTDKDLDEMLNDNMRVIAALLDVSKVARSLFMSPIDPIEFPTAEKPGTNASLLLKEFYEGQLTDSENRIKEFQTAFNTNMSEEQLGKTIGSLERFIAAYILPKEEREYALNLIKKGKADIAKGEHLTTESITVKKMLTEPERRELEESAKPKINKDNFILLLTWLDQYNHKLKDTIANTISLLLNEIDEGNGIRVGLGEKYKTLQQLLKRTSVVQNKRVESLWKVISDENSFLATSTLSYLSNITYKVYKEIAETVGLPGSGHGIPFSSTNKIKINPTDETFSKPYINDLNKIYTDVLARATKDRIPVTLVNLEQEITELATTDDGLAKAYFGKVLIQEKGTDKYKRPLMPDEEKVETTINPTSAETRQILRNYIGKLLEHDTSMDAAIIARTKTVISQLKAKLAKASSDTRMNLVLNGLRADIKSLTTTNPKDAPSAKSFMENNLDKYHEEIQKQINDTFGSKTPTAQDSLYNRLLRAAAATIVCPDALNYIRKINAVSESLSSNLDKLIEILSTSEEMRSSEIEMPIESELPRAAKQLLTMKLAAQEFDPGLNPGLKERPKTEKQRAEAAMLYAEKMSRYTSLILAAIADIFAPFTQILDIMEEDKMGEQRQYGHAQAIRTALKLLFKMSLDIMKVRGLINPNESKWLRSDTMEALKGRYKTELRLKIIEARGSAATRIITQDKLTQEAKLSKSLGTINEVAIHLGYSSEFFTKVLQLLQRNDVFRIWLGVRGGHLEVNPQFRHQIHAVPTAAWNKIQEQAGRMSFEYLEDKTILAIQAFLQKINKTDIKIHSALELTALLGAAVATGEMGYTFVDSKGKKTTVYPTQLDVSIYIKDILGLRKLLAFGGDAGINMLDAALESNPELKTYIEGFAGNIDETLKRQILTGIFKLKSYNEWLETLATTGKKGLDQVLFNEFIGVMNSRNKGIVALASANKMFNCFDEELQNYIAEIRSMKVTKSTEAVAPAAYGYHIEKKIQGIINSTDRSDPQKLKDIIKLTDSFGQSVARVRLDSKVSRDLRKFFTVLENELNKFKQHKIVRNNIALNPSSGMNTAVRMELENVLAAEPIKGTQFNVGDVIYAVDAAAMAASDEVDETKPEAVQEFEEKTKEAEATLSAKGYSYVYLLAEAQFIINLWLDKGSPNHKLLAGSPELKDRIQKITEKYTLLSTILKAFAATQKTSSIVNTMALLFKLAAEDIQEYNPKVEDANAEQDISEEAHIEFSNIIGSIMQEAAKTQMAIKTLENTVGEVQQIEMVLAHRQAILELLAEQSAGAPTGQPAVRLPEAKKQEGLTELQKTPEATETTSPIDTKVEEELGAAEMAAAAKNILPIKRGGQHE